MWPNILSDSLFSFRKNIFENNITCVELAQVLPGAIYIFPLEVAAYKKAKDEAETPSSTHTSTTTHTMLLLIVTCTSGCP
jgi:hypothetical protein